MASHVLLFVILALSFLIVSEAPLPTPPAGGSHDPHFVGGHGTRYDFNGEPGKTYCLISDKGVHVNALFKGYYQDTAQGEDKEMEHNVRTWMGELGFLWADKTGKTHSLHLVARKGPAPSTGLVESVTFDGATVAASPAPGPVVDTAGVKLSFLGAEQSAVQAREKWALTLEDKLAVEIDVDPAMRELRLPGDDLVHFSFRIQHFKVSNGVHGVLGQTFRTSPVQILKTLKYKALGSLLREPVRGDGATGLGFLEGTAEDYESTSVLKAECKFASF